VDYYLKEVVRAEYSAPPQGISTPPIQQYQLNQQPHALKCVFHLGEHGPTSCTLRDSPLRNPPAPIKKASPPRTIFTAAPERTRQLKKTQHRKGGYKSKWRLKNKGGVAVPVPPEGWKSSHKDIKHYALLGKDWDTW
jgi:hypothetical protein